MKKINSMRTVSLYIILSFCLMSLKCEPANSAAVVSRNGPFPIGVNAFDPFGNPEEFDERCGWFLSQIHELGINSIRLPFSWRHLEPEPGKYQWEFMDKVVEVYRQAGVHVSGVLVGPSAWAKNEAAPSTEEERQRFAQFVNQAVTHFNVQIQSWEIWDSPNSGFSWKPEPDPSEYASALKLAFTAATAADPATKILSPSLLNCDIEYLEDIYSQGIADRFNILSSNVLVPVGQETAVQDCVDHLERAMLNYEKALKRIWLTDLGFTQPIAAGENTEAMEKAHAVSLVKASVQSLAEPVVERAYLSTLVDLPLQGQTMNLGLVKEDRTSRTAFLAFRTMTEQLYGKSYQGEVYLAPSVKAYLFIGQKQDSCMVIWATSGKRKVTLPASTTQVRVTDMKNEKTWQLCLEGIVELDVDTAPLFVEVDSSLLRLNASFYFQEPTMTLTCNSPGINNVTLLNFLSEPVSGPLKFQLPPGWSADPGGGFIRLSPFQRETLTASFKTPANCTPGAYNIEAILTLEQKGKRETRDISTGFRAFVVEPAELSVSPRMATDSLEIGVRLRNNSQSALSGNLFLDFSPRLLENPFQERIESLTPQFGTSYTFQIGREYLVSNPFQEVVAQFVSSNGESVRSLPLKISRQPFQDQSPTVDGKVKNWLWSEQIALDSEAQIVRQEDPKWTVSRGSAEVEFCWTSDTLYLAALVNDKAPMINDASGADMASGDSIEILFDFSGPDEGLEPSENEYHLIMGTGRGGHDPQVYEASRNRLLETAEIKVRKARGGYSLEAAVPLSELGDFSPVVGKIFSFDVLLNDRDSYEDNAPRATLSWAQRMGKTNRPSNWGLGVIVPLCIGASEF